MHLSILASLTTRSFLSCLTLLALTHLPVTLAKTIRIDVGEFGQNFSPQLTTANINDELHFHFWPHDHSVAQSGFSSPCQPLTGGVFSGFVAENDGEGKKIFAVTVNTTDPIYFYCSQKSHCQNGMAMVVNPPSNNEGLHAYKTAAKSVTTISPTTVEGGVFIDAAAANDTAAASASSSAETATSSTGTSTLTTSATTSASGVVSSSGGISTSTSSTTAATASATAKSGAARSGSGFGGWGFLGWTGMAALGMVI